MLRALSHPLWLLEKTARVETLFIQESSAERSSFHRGCSAVCSASKNPLHNFSLARAGGRPRSYLLRDGVRGREHAPAFHGRLLLRLNKRPVRHELQLVVLQTQPGVERHGACEMQTVLGPFLPSQPCLGAGGDPYLDSSRVLLGEFLTLVQFGLIFLDFCSQSLQQNSKQKWLSGQLLRVLS